MIHAYDPAIVDHPQWRRWKQGRGIYIITMEKSNCVLGKIKDLLFDDTDPRNTGILSDEMVGNAKGILPPRRIRYRDPETGKIFSYLTNEFTLPPGLLAFIHKLRKTTRKPDEFPSDLICPAFANGSSGDPFQRLEHGS